MNRPGALLLAVLALAVAGIPSGLSQLPNEPVPRPDTGPVNDVVDEAGGTVVVPALATLYEALGQNITREDVRMIVDLNFTKGDVGILGLLVGSGTAEVQAKIHARLEMRVISTQRIRDALEASGMDLQTENLTFLKELYLPAETFRASLSAEAIAAFQEEEEKALADYLAASVPELQVLSLQIAWSHTFPLEAFTDTSLTEPPIVAELDLVVQYLRVESIPSLLDAYLSSGSEDDNETERLKQGAGDPLRTRDFFAAAAYTQLLNLSMQPGWSLDLAMHVPRGYEFTYLAGEVDQQDPRSVSLHLDALSSDDEVHQVFLASITQPKAVALALFVAMWVAGLVVAWPLRFAYSRWRVPRWARASQKQATSPDST